VTVAAAEPARPGDRLGRGVGWLTARRGVVLHVLSLLAGLAVLEYYGRSAWFKGDEWDFIAGRSVSLQSLFRPHNAHWSTLPILAYRALLSIFGVKTYLPYLTLLIVVHLLLVHVLWRVAVRYGADPLVAAGAGAVFALLGAGSENLFWAFQVGFVGSVLFGWLAVLALAQDQWSGRRRILLAWLSCLAALMCSDIGVVMTAVVVLTALLATGWRRAAVVGSVPVVCFASWYLAIGHLAGDFHHREPLSRLGAYIGYGLTNAFGTAFLVPGWGLLPALVLLGWLAYRAVRRSPPSAAIFAGAIGAVLLFVLVGTGRVRLGVYQAGSSRYIYLTVALVLPAVARALSDLWARASAARLVTVGLLAYWLTVNVGMLGPGAAAEASLAGGSRARILGAEVLLQRHLPAISSVPDPRFTPDLDLVQLVRVIRAGWLPQPPAGQAGYDLLSAESYLESSGRRAGGGLAGSRLTARLFAAPPARLSSHGRCVTAVAVGAARVVVTVVTGPTGAGLVVSPDTARPITVYALGNRGQHGLPASYGAGGAPILLRLAPLHRWLLVFPGETVGVCGTSVDTAPRV
jgi:hypothetical protein